MKLISLIVLVLCVSLACIAATLFFYSHFVIKDVKEVYMDIKVSDRGGFNLDQDALHFGIAMPGSSAQRDISVYNNYNFPITVLIKKRGALSEWVESSQTEIALNTNETMNVTFVVKVPENASFGKYNGTVLFVIKKR